MLDPDEEHAIAEQFGVARTQVRRDHLISHLLAALSEHAGDDVLFFGGTALSRTLAPHGRLSEDIDLIARHNRRVTAERLDKTLLRATRREFPGLQWQPPVGAVRDTAPAILSTPDGTTVRIQLLNATGYAPWPTERHQLVQRYRDAPAATLTVPTAPSFVGWKPPHGSTAPPPATSTTSGSSPTSAPSAPSALRPTLFAKLGQTNKAPGPELFTDAPDEATWRRDLAGQTRLRVTATEALTKVRDTWR